MGALFLYLDSTKCAIKVSVLHRNGTNMQQPSIKIASARPSLLELVFARDMARVNMVIVKLSLCFTTIVHGSFMSSFKKSPFNLKFEMPRGQKVSCLLATSFKILVANT